MDRGVVPTNQNPRLTRLRQPRSVRGDREGRIGSSWVSMIGVQVQRSPGRVPPPPPPQSPPLHLVPRSLLAGGFELATSQPRHFQIGLDIRRWHHAVPKLRGLRLITSERLDERKV